MPVVDEADVAHLDAERAVGQRDRARRGRDRDLLGEDGLQAVVADHRPRQLGEDPADEPHRPREQAEQRDEPDQLAGVDRAGRDPPRADREQDDGGERRQRVERRPRTSRARSPPRTRSSRRASRRVLEPLRLELLASEGLDDERAVDRLVRDRRDDADVLLAMRAGSSMRRAKLRFIRASAGNSSSADEREPRVGPEQLDHREQHERDHARPRTAPARTRRPPPSRRPPCGRAARRSASRGGTAAAARGSGPTRRGEASPSRARRRRRE